MTYNKLIIFVLSACVLSSCYTNHFFNDSGNQVIEKEYCWGTGSGRSSRGTQRCNVYSKTYNRLGELVEYKFEKKFYSGCTVQITFFKKVKLYDKSGKVISSKVEIKEQKPNKRTRKGVNTIKY